MHKRTFEYMVNGTNVTLTLEFDAKVFGELQAVTNQDIQNHVNLARDHKLVFGCGAVLMLSCGLPDYTRSNVLGRGKFSIKITFQYV